MEEFGFNKIDEEDLFNPKQTPENMRSLHEVNTIMDSDQNVSLSDVEINSKVSELDSVD